MPASTSSFDPSSTRKRPTLGVLTDWTLFYETIDSFLLALYRGMAAASRQCDCNLLIGCSIATQQAYGNQVVGPLLETNGLFAPVGHWNTDGLIVVAPILNEGFRSYIEGLRTEGFPLVAVGPLLDLPRVQVDNVGGIHQALAHLAGHGHRRIAFVSGVQNETGDSLMRLNAYWEAVQKLGLEADPRLVVYGEHWDRPSRKAILELLEKEVPFTAVLASNDASAYGALQALREAGRRVPEDVAVMGFDDLPTSALQTPPLSTIRSSQFEMGYQAVRLLRQRLAGQTDQIVINPVRLVLRRSCGCQLADTLTITHPSSQVAPGQADLNWLVESIREVIAAQSHYLSAGVIDDLSQRLVTAFNTSLTTHHPETFQAAVLECLSQVEAAQDIPNLLQMSLLAITEAVPRLVHPHEAAEIAYTMLAQAQVLIGQHDQSQYTVYTLQQSRNFTQMGFLNAHLLTALTEHEILEHLAAQLPYAGFSSALVAFYQSQGDDPVARSQAYRLSQGTVTEWSQAFPTRAFPPPGLYPNDRPFQLALFSLQQQRAYGNLAGFAGPDGFAAFDITYIEECVPIVLELAAVFKSIRLYQAAVSGQHLAEEANQLKSRFLASVSHELRTPLNLLIGLSEMLMAAKDRPGAPPFPEEYQGDIERIHGNAEHLGWLIRDVLDLASSQVGQLRLACDAVTLKEVLVSAITAGEQLARAKGLAWEAHLDGDLPRVWGDAARIRQVVLNLISNAVKFTDQGRVTLTVSRRTDMVREPAPEPMVVISIRDTGIGISARDQAVIFDEFRQAEGTIRRGYGGMGLGLAISKRIVTMHGGDIGVVSSGKETRGSTFTFRLPVLYESPETLLAALPIGVSPVWLAAARREEIDSLAAQLHQTGREPNVVLADADPDWQEHLLAAQPQVVVIAASLAQRQWEWIAAQRAHRVAFWWYASAGEVSASQTPASDESIQLPVVDDLAVEAFCIVVADDEPGLLNMNSRLIQKQFAASKVLQASDGRQALALIQHNLPDLVILDLHMPHLDGFGVLEAMRQGETTRQIPVILLTAQVLSESEMARLDKGVATVLEKGLFNHEEILARIQHILVRSHKVGSDAQKLARKAMAYIHTHYAEPLTRGHIARHVGVTDRYLTRCFQQELAMPPMTYLTRYRVKQAKLLLATTHQSVTEIALSVGFGSISSFTQAFQRDEKLSPSAYRRALPSH